jgi:integrase
MSNQDMGKKINSAIFKIVDSKGNLSKRWYVEYYIFDGLERLRKRAYINRGATADERYAEANRIITASLKTPEKLEARDCADLGNSLEKAMLKRGRHLRAKTKATYISKINIFLEWAKTKKYTVVGEITKAAVDEFYTYLHDVRLVSLTTQNHYQRYLFTLFSDFVRKESNPFARGVLPSPAPTPALWFQKSQRILLKTYISENDAQLWRFIEFIFYCFIRPGELRQLQVSDVFLENSQILMRKEISKNKKDQYIIIPQPFLPTLLAMGFDKANPNDYVFSGNGFFGAIPLSTNKMSYRHQQILKHLKFDTTRHKLYSWKHTGAVAVVKAGIHIKQLQMQLRHHSLDQVNEYLRDLGIADLDELKNNYPEI